jgi:hypothetical protein
MQQEFSDGDRVIYRVLGTGRVFPRGRHWREATIIKPGSLEDCYLIEVDQPIGKDKVICAHLTDLEAAK